MRANDLSTCHTYKNYHMCKYMGLLEALGGLFTRYPKPFGSFSRETSGHIDTAKVNVLSGFIIS